MKHKRKLKKGFKTLFILVLGIIILKYAYPYLNDIEIDSNGSIIIDDNISTNESTSNNNNNYVDDSIYDSVSSEKNNVGTIKERLKKLSKEDSRINEILDNYNDYPEALLDMLSRNIKMTDFVLDYPEKKGKIFSETIGKVKKGTFPLLLQWDSRWGYGKYGDDNVAIGGCAPTALSMVIAGLTGKNNITPYDVAKYSEKDGHYLSGTGTSWSLMTLGSKHFGVEGKELPLTKNNIYNALESGKPIICSMRKGDFTTVGHFIVLVGIEDGKIKINDPNSEERSSILWEYDRIEKQIKNLWVFTRI